MSNQSFSPPVILVWKDRRNVHGEVTISRFIVSFENFYYQVIGRHDNYERVSSSILINVEVKLLKELKDLDDVKKYGEYFLKGRDNGILQDHGRSTHDNITLYRIRNVVQNAVLAYCQNQCTEPTIYDSMELRHNSISVLHNNIDRYNFDSGFDNLSMDTASSLNGSDRSGDTRADEIYSPCEKDVLTIMSLVFSIEKMEQEQNYKIIDKVTDLVCSADDEIYSDCVAFRKAVDTLNWLHKYQNRDQTIILFNFLVGIPALSLIIEQYCWPTMVDLSEIRKQYWLSTDLYKQISNLLKTDEKNS